ncbi:DNA repair protein RAD5 [Tetrabaena socialis]|uniref:DNA repair protein RAD5 n=1 Tax=Tetrabaena socialis TaxID=47790 RepID=A0A2J8A0L7_9CHLO|nr:DNA repair protein RAD5 [Tetrabaena socialis]|eukprot:PNH06056.1 DNA repair protein RAD5 [Tetrabaena socialis]
MSSRIVDLTLSSDEDEAPARKRPRTTGPAPRPRPEASGDVMIVGEAGGGEVERTRSFSSPPPPDRINTSAHHNCPSCRHPITLASLRRGVRAEPPPPEPKPKARAKGRGKRGAAADSEEEDEEDGDEAAAEGAPPGSARCESKLRTLMAELRAMRAADPTAKALVFTQFSQSLEWLKPRLKSEGFGHRTITGDMHLRKRTEAIDSFQHDPATTVFLLSVRSGAVGINLTAADHVFLMEPCMNPAMEEQAIGRAWRMGQQRPVVVKRLVVQGSVEERIMEVVRTRRAASGSSAAAADPAAAGPSSAAAATAPSGGRSGAGSLRADKVELRINELDLLFSEPAFRQA